MSSFSSSSSSSSSFGQGCLRQLPSHEQPLARMVSDYELPSELTAERKSLTGSKSGIDVFKVSKNGRLQPRRIAFSTDIRSIYVTSKKIKSLNGLWKALTPQDSTARSIDITSIERIERGTQTNRFIAARAMNKLPIREDKTDVENICVSIIYRVSTRHLATFVEGLGGPKVRGPHRFDSLDLLVPKEDEYEALVTSLEELMLLHREERQYYDAFSLFMEFQWVDMGKERSQKLVASEWITLCEACNIPLKRSPLQAYYKDFCDKHAIGEEGITLHQTADLLNAVKNSVLLTAHTDLERNDADVDPLEDLWLNLVESDPVPPLKMDNDDDTVDNNMELQVDAHDESISAVAFLGFLRTQQKEVATTLSQVQELFLFLNTEKSLLNAAARAEHDELGLPIRERLNKDKFLSYIMSDVNDIMDPVLGQMGADDVDQPLTKYWINTSHDTYLAKLPNTFRFRDMDYENYHAVDVRSYTQALYRGVRCLELDIYDGLLIPMPVVARQKPVSTADNQSIPFSQVLKMVRSFLRDHPYSFPIILYMETHCSISNQIIMAKELNDILGSEDMLFIPTSDMLNNESNPLPSPHALRGKVVIKNKRPKIIREGATVPNDDLDDDNNLPLKIVKDDNSDDEDDDDAPGTPDVMIATEEDEDEFHCADRGIVVRFEAAGPIRSTDPDAPKYTPSELLDIARRERLQAKKEAAQAEAKELQLKDDAESTKSRAEALIAASGLSLQEIEARATLENSRSGNGSSPGNLGSGGSRDLDEGMEVQEFFGDAVMGARNEYSEADAHASIAAQAAAQALARLTEAEQALDDAESKLQISFAAEKEKTIAARHAANTARANREHADTAKRRVDTVKDLLRNSKDNAASAGTVVVTAMTEAKISEQRASETEARAARARQLAEKERARAEAETAREEALEQEAAALHELNVAVTKESKATRDRMEKAAAMLDKVNEQIKLIERSSQFQREIQELKDHSIDTEDLDSTPKYGGSFVAKHVSKLEERQSCIEQIKEASLANQTAEKRRKGVQAAFEEKAHMWKLQAESASQARKQADRSSQHAEDLTEHAQEEREAASLRQMASDKAKSSVSQTDYNQTSIQAQVIEAARAAEEAASIALESRILAEKLLNEAELAKDHSIPVQYVEKMKKRRKEAEVAYKAALSTKEDAVQKAGKAKRLLDTSSEVYINAKRDAAAEVNNANARRQVEREAVQAFRKASIASKLVESAILNTKLAKETAVEKAAAECRAEEYKLMMDRRAPVVTELALMTTLNSTKLKSWEKSQTLPTCQMHSIAHVRICQMVQKDESLQRENFEEFTHDHFVRTFPSWPLIRENQSVNCDSVVSHALGCQLVSMNFHSSDEHLLINDGRFRANGSCGYVLKPSPLDFEQRKETWRFTILAGSCLPKGESAMTRKTIVSVGGSLNYISPFVRVSLYEGMTRDDGNIVYETKPSKRNGINPTWGETSSFDVIVEKPSIAMIMFSVYDYETNDFIAAAALPVNSMRPGYRSVALFDSLHSRCGPYAYASLLVRAQKL